MDLSLARVLDDLRHAAHEAAPGVPVGIEGTQMPHAFGGYDCWRLSQALDWVEPYDIGNAREIFGSFMPNRPLMTTVFESDPLHASRRLWHLLLEGDRGCIIWWSEDCIDWQSADYSLTSKAQALAPVLKEMKSSLAALFLRAERLRDPIYIHYSQPSIQVDWLLESTADGSTWLRRFSSFEADYNRMAKVRNGWLKLFQDLGFSPVFVSSDQIERGCLDRAGSAVVVLPGSLAMSSKEVAAVRQFIRKATGSVAQRQVFFDGQPGIFDEHAKLRSRGPFPEAEAVVVGAFECGAFDSGGVEKAKELDMAKYGVERLGGGGAKWTAWLANKLESQVAEISVPAGSCTRVHRFKSGSARLVAFERNINYQMSEDLKQAGGNEALERPMEIEAGLSKAAHVYDLRQLKYLGQVSGLKFTLDAWRPSLFALTDSPLPTGNILEELEKLRLSQ